MIPFTNLLHLTKVERAGGRCTHCHRSYTIGSYKVILMSQAGTALMSAHPDCMRDVIQSGCLPTPQTSGLWMSIAHKSNTCRICYQAILAKTDILNMRTPELCSAVMHVSCVHKWLTRDTAFMDILVAQYIQSLLQQDAFPALRIVANSMMKERKNGKERFGYTTANNDSIPR